MYNAECLSLSVTIGTGGLQNAHRCAIAVRPFLLASITHAYTPPVANTAGCHTTLHVPQTSTRVALPAPRALCLSPEGLPSPSVQFARLPTDSGGGHITEPHPSRITFRFIRIPVRQVRATCNTAHEGRAGVSAGVRCPLVSARRPSAHGGRRRCPCRADGQY